MQVKERVKNVEKAQQIGGFSVMHTEDLRKVWQSQLARVSCRDGPLYF